MIERALVHNTAFVASTDILPAAVAPTRPPTTFRIQCCFSDSGVLNAMITRGGVTHTQHLNSNVELKADSLYTFDVMMSSGETLNLQYVKAATVRIVKIIEIWSR